MAIRLVPPDSTSKIEIWAEILMRVEGLVIGAEELRHSFEQDRESLWTLAYLDGEPAGTAVGRPSSIAGSNYAMARVLPEKRGRGVGTALLAAISEHARGAGRSSLWGRIRADDSESLRFAAGRGFEETGRDRPVVLDLTRCKTESAAPPPGIELVNLAERPDLVEAVFAVDAEVAPDVPGLEDHAPSTFERWHRENLEGPGALPAACIVALAGGDIVGYTALRRRGPDSPLAENLLTAVLRPWRGRGIATALKRAQIEQARAAGIEQIFTTNDETNAAMRGVNARLGYEPLSEEIIVRGPLAAEAS